MQIKDKFTRSTLCIKGIDCLAAAVVTGSYTRHLSWGIAAFFILSAASLFVNTGEILPILCSVAEAVILYALCSLVLSETASGFIALSVFCLLLSIHKKWCVVSNDRVYGYSFILSETLLFSFAAWHLSVPFPVVCILSGILIIMTFLPVLRTVVLAVLTVGLSFVTLTVTCGHMDISYSLFFTLIVLLYTGYSNTTVCFQLVRARNRQHKSAGKPQSHNPAITKISSRKPKSSALNIGTSRTAHAKNYYRQSYYLITHNHYRDILNDKGKYGEYLIYDTLQRYERLGGKFLFNCYLNKNNQTTTEIDVLFICRSGIFVFESKNYSGLICGNPSVLYWTQILRAAKGTFQKNTFYNPVMQNNTHIKSLRKVIGNNIPVFSVIVFSDQCTLKIPKTRLTDTFIIQRKELTKVVDSAIRRTGNKLRSSEIAALYRQLYPFTQVRDSIKKQHIINIKKGLNKNNMPAFYGHEKNHRNYRSQASSASKNKKLILLP